MSDHEAQMDDGALCGLRGRAGHAAAAAPGPAQFAQSENCLSGLFEALQGSGFVTAEDGQVRYRSGWGDWQRFEPGFVTVEGQLYHVEADGVTFTRLPLGLSVVDGSVCYSSDGLSIQTFAPGFVTLDGRLYRVAADGYSFECRTAGVYLLGDEVYCVPADGAEFLTNGVYNGLQFGPTAATPAAMPSWTAWCGRPWTPAATPSMTQEEKLRAAYLYLRDNGRYLARSHYPPRERGLGDGGGTVLSGEPPGQLLRLRGRLSVHGPAAGLPGLPGLGRGGL